MIQILTIENEKGLHARASAKFVETVEGFDAEAEVTSVTNTDPVGKRFGTVKQ